MKSGIHKIITLELTEQEALWLKAVVQNPINVENLEDEEPYDNRRRRAFWGALVKIGD